VGCPARADPRLKQFADTVDCGDGADIWRADLDDLPSSGERACETIDSPDRGDKALFQFIMDNNFIVEITDYHPEYLRIFPPDALAKLPDR